MERPRIFVNIASYRDPECQWTIKDLFEKARDPGRIFVGLCNQLIEAEDAHCLQVVTRPEQVREIRIDARESKGCCWARAQVQTLWRGEEYSLQIDSHSRFIPNWDDEILAMHTRCPSRKSVISCYAPRYSPPDQLEADRYVTMRVHHFHQQGLIQTRGTSRPASEAPAAPEPTALCAGHFLFGPAAVIDEVPSDPRIYFWGEEISLAVRLWTHGWDIYMPNRTIVYHRMDNSGRPLHWEDQPQGGGIAPMAARRLRHMLGIKECDDPEVLAELDRYGLGKVRSLQEYEAFSGLDFRNRLIDGKTDEDIMLEDDDYRRMRNEEIFFRVRQKHLHSEEKTWAGPHSTLAMTENIRTRLPRLFQARQIALLADAGCGDFEWMSEISGSLSLYFGFDIAGKDLNDVRAKYGRTRGHFFANADITVDLLPACDAILCRDVLTYLSLGQSLLALKLFKQSGSRFLLATTYTEGENSALDTGFRRPLCLTAPPFNLPPPRQLIRDRGSFGKAIGLWEISDIPDL